MEWTWVLSAMLAAVCLLTLIGQPVAIALASGGLVGIILVGGIERTTILSSVLWNSLDSFLLTAVPLFILMGQLLLRSGMSEKFFLGISYWLAAVPGGLLHGNVLTASFMAAISGSSVAIGGALAPVAVPEMDKRSYSRELTFSSLAAGGAVGMLIPPSLVALIYASLVQVSVTDLFIAGLVPGLMLSGTAMLYLAVRVLLRPDLAPRSTERVDMRHRLRGLWLMSPVVGLVLVVLGSIYGGLATPTEAAALGVGGVLTAIVVGGRARPAMLWESLGEAVRISAGILFIIVGAQVVSAAIGMAGAGRGVAEWVVGLGLSNFGFFAAIVIAYLVLGAFVDGLSMMVLTLPIILPIALSMGWDPIVFGVVLTLLIEIGQITPPIGVDLFVYKSSVPDASMLTISRAAIPIVAIALTVTFLVYFFPTLATVLI